MAATPTLISQAIVSIDEYLHTRYRPDCHYVDGQLEERRPPEGEYTPQQIEELFVGEYEHNKLQKLLLIWLFQHEGEWHIECVPEQRIHVSQTRIRVCDVCVLRADAPREQVTLTPPLLCIEIMSPKDRLSRARIVLEDYRLMGVPNIWLINPFRRVAYTYDSTGLHDAHIDRIEVPDSPIHILLADMLSQIF
jgi:Uma2 family endonuclease